MHISAPTHSPIKTPSIYGVSEDEMLHYQNLFTDSGNTRAQASAINTYSIIFCVLRMNHIVSLIPGLLLKF